MAVADAVMQMDLSDQPFILFRNASHGEINVVYRREDGNIGWIDPAAPLRSMNGGRHTFQRQESALSALGGNDFCVVPRSADG